jgi:hypothetical protein
MSPIAVIILIIVIIVVIGAIAFGVRAARRRKLQNTFGPEYDRVVADSGNRAEAEKELRERERRHAELELRPLSPESQAKYSSAWEEAQIQFVDSPERAVNTADDLVGRLMAERGYPTGDFDERVANLSVEHASTLGHYRDAHEINKRNQNGEASTEDLRQALVHYRALFADLLGTDPVADQTKRDVPGTPTAHSADTVGAADRQSARSGGTRATDAPTTGTPATGATPAGTTAAGGDLGGTNRTADTTSANGHAGATAAGRASDVPPQRSSEGTDRTVAEDTDRRTTSSSDQDPSPTRPDAR